MSPRGGGVGGDFGERNQAGPHQGGEGREPSGIGPTLGVSQPGSGMPERAAGALPQPSSPFPSAFVSPISVPSHTAT